MKIVTIHAAKTHLSRLIEDVAGGERVVIARGMVGTTRRRVLFVDVLAYESPETPCLAASG